MNLELFLVGNLTRAGDYQIVLRKETNLGWCVERTLQIVDLVSETAREVRHWQYLAWPASGV